MAIPITGSGGLFTRLGHLYGRIADMDALRGGTATTRVLAGASLATGLTTIETDYFNGTAIPATIDGIATNFNTYQSTFSTFYNQLAGQNGYAAATIIKMAALDQAQPDATLKTALTYLIKQMAAAAAHIAPSTVALGAQTASGSPNGTGVIVGSLVRGDGQTLQTPFPETLTFTCITDSQTGGATVNREVFSVAGAAAVTDATSYLWPGGSGITNVQLSVTDPTASNNGNNLTYNGDFETFSNGSSAAPPDNWVALVGAAQMARSTTSYFNTYALQFTGDSATLTSVAQPFNTAANTALNAGGTPATLTPQTVYIANLNYKLSAGSPVAGVLALELVDGSNNVINDANGTANTVNVNLNTIADTNWHQLNAAFRLPALLPSTVKLRVRLSTALTTGTNVFIDGVAMNKATQLYTGGPFFSVFAGSTKFLLNDAWTLALTNTYGGFAKMLERFFGLRAMGLQFPYAGGGTSVLDSLIA